MYGGAIAFPLDRRFEAQSIAAGAAHEADLRDVRSHYEPTYLAPSLKFRSGEIKRGCLAGRRGYMGSEAPVPNVHCDPMPLGVGGEHSDTLPTDAKRVVYSAVEHLP